MLVLVTYDLNTPGKNYDSLYQVLKSISANYIRPLESVWLFDTVLTPESIWTKLSACIDTNDRLLAVALKKESAGWLTAVHWEWINSRSMYSW